MKLLAAITVGVVAIYLLAHLVAWAIDITRAAAIGGGDE